MTSENGRPKYKKYFSPDQTIEYFAGQFGCYDPKIIKKIIERFNNKPKLENIEVIELPYQQLLSNILYVFKIELGNLLKKLYPKEIVIDTLRGITQTPFIKQKGEWFLKNPDDLREKLQNFFEEKTLLDEASQTKIENIQFQTNRIMDKLFTPANYDVETRFKLEHESIFRWLNRNSLPKKNNRGCEFEIAVAEHCQNKNILCEYCKNPNIRLAGGYGNPYVDMICTRCGSLYEIKSKTQNTIEKIKSLPTYRLYGGSYRHYIELEKRRQKTNIPHYIVLVSYDEGENKGGCVYIGIITNVRFQLCKESFLCTKPQIKSIIERGDMEYWFKFDTSVIPSCEENGKYYKMKQQIIAEKIDEYVIKIQKCYRRYRKKYKNK
jgi:hypothetical protein